MERRVRGLLAVVATIQAILAILFVLKVPWATAVWPFTGTSEMSYIFIASIFLAAAAAVGWCLLEGSDRALAGIALDYWPAPGSVSSGAAGGTEWPMALPAITRSSRSWHRLRDIGADIGLLMPRSAPSLDAADVLAGLPDHADR